MKETGVWAHEYLTFYWNTDSKMWSSDQNLFYFATEAYRPSGLSGAVKVAPEELGVWNG